MDIIDKLRKTRRVQAKKLEKVFLRNFKKVLDKVEGFGYNRKAAVDAAGEP